MRNISRTNKKYRNNVCPKKIEAYLKKRYENYDSPHHLQYYQNIRMGYIYSGML